MIKNYLLVMMRYILRHPVYFVINIFGLSTGLACCLMIYFYVSHELSYDRFHSRFNRLYRVNYDMLMGGNRTISPSVPVFVAPHLAKQFPEVEAATRLSKVFNPIAVKVSDDKLFDEPGMAWADANFLDLFDFKLLKGDRSGLSKPGSIFLTESMARKYFGEEDPVGKSLTVGSVPYEVAGILDDVPSNSFIDFTLLASFSTLKLNDDRIEWNNPNYETYLLLRDGVDLAGLQAKINHWVTPADDRRKQENQLFLPVEPLSEAHFNDKVFNFQGQLPITDVRYLYTFSIIAAIILAMACVNYVNLSTARAIHRAREVGIRKTSGAGYGQLLTQFLGESSLYILMALILAGAMSAVLLPTLSSFLGKPIPANLAERNFIFTAISGWVVLSVLAGLYPAVVLSRFKPLSVLKGKVGAGDSTLRRTLVVIQFSVSTLLIFASLIIYAQLRFMQNKKLGLEKEHAVFVRGNRDLTPYLDAFIREIQQLPGVETVAGCWRSPFQTVAGNGLDLTPNNPQDEWVLVGGIAGDENYLAAAGLDLINGRNFDPAKVKDSINEFLVNEAFFRDFGIDPADVLGKEIVLGLVGRGTIVGTVRDFHFASLHESIRPVVIFNSREYQSSILIRFAGGNPSGLLSGTGNIWKRLVPNRPFNYTFLDEQYQHLYQSEQRVNLLTGLFSTIAVSIACLGLLGLAAFTTSQRMKEIAVRKVLGATVSNIVLLLTGDYLKLTLIAFVVAIPLGYWAMQNWLSRFAYRIEVAPWHYLLALLTVILIAWLTVGYQSLKASVANPVSGLRSE